MCVVYSAACSVMAAMVPIVNLDKLMMMPPLVGYHTPGRSLIKITVGVVVAVVPTSSRAPVKVHDMYVNH